MLILGIGHGFQVCWVHARRVAAQVVQLEITRNRPGGKEIGHAMGELVAMSALLPGCLPVTPLIQGSRPDPAWAKFGLMLRHRAAFVDLGPETFNALFILIPEWITMPVPAAVVLPAPTSGVARPIATINGTCTIGHVTPP
jgi:hypothetical protein